MSAWNGTRLSVETGEGHVRGGVPVVVGGRESRPRGEGGQETDRFLMLEESVDTDAQADRVWLLGVQRKLYQWSNTLWSLESRIHRETCTSGSVRGYGVNRRLRGRTALVAYSTH